MKRTYCIVLLLFFLVGAFSFPFASRAADLTIVPHSVADNFPNPWPDAETTKSNWICFTVPVGQYITSAQVMTNRTDPSVLQADFGNWYIGIARGYATTSPNMEAGNQKYTALGLADFPYNNYETTTLEFDSSFYFDAGEKACIGLSTDHANDGKAFRFGGHYPTTDTYVGVNTFQVIGSGATLLNPASFTRPSLVISSTAIDPDALKILTPPNNSTIVNEFVNTGTCSDSFDYFLYQGSSIASSTDLRGQSLQCSSGAWSVNSGFLPYGLWSVYVSSTGQFDGAVYFNSAQSYEYIPITATSSNPYSTSTDIFGSITCDSESSLAIFCTIAKRLSTGRPLAYFPQIVGALWTAMDNATPTAWIAPISFTAPDGPHEISGIGTSTLAAVPSGFTNTIRPLSTVAFALAFVWLIWSLRHRIL